MSDAKVRGRFVWHELLTSDPKAGAAFYTKVVGWKTQAWSEDGSYTMFVAKTGPMAGYMSLPDEAKAMGARPCWMSYIGTPDVDETARLAEQLGGTVLRAPEDIPNIGRFAVIRDPQGAVFSAYTPAQAPRAPEKTALGDFSWHELATSDLEAAFDFYRALFGWEKTESMDMGPTLGTYQMYGWKGMTLGGMFNKPPAMPGPPNWLPYALVPDAKRAAEIVKQLGGQIVNGPMEVPGGGWIAQGLDPQGVYFAVHSEKPTVAVVPKKPAAQPAGRPVKKPARKATARGKAAPRKAAKRAKPAKKAAAKKPARKATARGKAAPRKAARRAKPKKKAAAKKRRR
jgi:predicted enzyme related to lactoylglutathione lyase